MSSDTSLSSLHNSIPAWNFAHCDSVEEYHPTYAYLSTLKTCRVELCAESTVLCYHPYLVSMLFADLDL